MVFECDKPAESQPKIEQDEDQNEELASRFMRAVSPIKKRLASTMNRLAERITRKDQINNNGPGNTP